MNWMNKLERKIGKYAIPNLILWLLGAYAVGFMLQRTNVAILVNFNLQPKAILHGQIWRIVTWVLQPTDTNIIFMLIMMFFYFQLGRALEHTWGTFRFNVYIFGGIIITVIGSIVLYGIIYLSLGADIATAASALMGSMVSTNYINLSIFLAFATMYPDMQVMLYFIIPVKMKWLAYVYVAVIGFNIVETYRSASSLYGTSIAILITVIMLVTIIMSLLNFMIFFFSSKNYKRISPKEMHRRKVYKAQTREPRKTAGVTKHKCAVCGRTEESNPELEFRFCSKCDGNYEYCQDHLFTHQHVKRN